MKKKLLESNCISTTITIYMPNSDHLAILRARNKGHENSSFLLHNDILIRKY
jgi:hypothetical protein